MKEKLTKYIEPNRKVKGFEILALILLTIGIIASFTIGLARVNSKIGTLKDLGEVLMTRDESIEDYDEDNTVCDVVFRFQEDSLTVTMSYEDYLDYDKQTLIAHGYETENGTRLFFDHPDPSQQEITSLYKQAMADQTMNIFNLGSSLLILGISIAIVMLFSSYFTLYEKCWFLSIMILATIFALIFPEESANGVNGIVIMMLYLLDTLLNILCELLISKQSRYNFLVSVLVEITEIVICIVLMYRFATMVVTLFFWLPIDIISFINWSRHKDEVEDELTAVRRLKGWQEALVILGIVVWTVVVGYLISGLNIETDFFNNKSLETIIIYIDACASAVGIANGLFIFFRLREQWLAWYICALLESVINILAGQYVLLILKLGYFTNTTYGYIKWSRYIKTHNEEAPSLF
ncbi:MAG: nicotinamide mononucleotide transporter [Erysipelotrichaceae bacterium]|nr:nicotinamide mononucleotide transporter [Erysipelotrichaceae bacterium]